MVDIPRLRCNQCGHEWIPRTESPKRCQGCGSYKWNKPKKHKEPK